MNWLPGLRFDRLVHAEIFDEPSPLRAPPYSTELNWARRVRKKMKHTAWRYHEQRTTDPLGFSVWRIRYERPASSSGALSCAEYVARSKAFAISAAALKARRLDRH